MAAKGRVTERGILTQYCDGQPIQFQYRVWVSNADPADVRVYRGPFSAKRWGVRKDLDYLERARADGRVVVYRPATAEERAADRAATRGLAVMFGLPVSATRSITRDFISGRPDDDSAPL